MFALPISMPRFKSIIFYQNWSKIKLFLQKMQNFRALKTKALPPAGEGFAPRPPKIAPIANFWLRTCICIASVVCLSSFLQDDVANDDFSDVLIERIWLKGKFPT